jgi:hypothetical protein
MRSEARGGMEMAQEDVPRLVNTFHGNDFLRKSGRSSLVLVKGMKGEVEMMEKIEIRNGANSLKMTTIVTEVWGVEVSRSGEGENESLDFDVSQRQARETESGGGAVIDGWDRALEVMRRCGEMPLNVVTEFDRS